MRTLPLFRREFFDTWRSTLGWAAGLAAAIFLYLPLYPSIGGSAQMQHMIDALPAEMTKALNYDQIATGPGYTQATLFGLLGFLLMTIASVSWGTTGLRSWTSNWTTCWVRPSCSPGWPSSAEPPRSAPAQ